MRGVSVTPLSASSLYLPSSWTAGYMLPEVTGLAGPRPSNAIGLKEANSDSCEEEGPQEVSLREEVGQRVASEQLVSLRHLRAPA